MISGSIKKIDALLRTYNPVNYGRLQSPLPDNEIKYYLQKIGIDDRDVFELYKWKNGVFPSIENRAMLFESRMSLLSLESVLLYKNMQEYDIDEDHVMLFANPFDEALLFNTGIDNYGKLHIRSVPLLSIEEPFSYYDSIALMLDSNIKGYESGIFEYDSSRDILNSNFKEVLKIFRPLNVESKYWHQFSTGAGV